jgi:hypothetical protein
MVNGHAYSASIEVRLHSSGRSLNSDNSTVASLGPEQQQP